MSLNSDNAYVVHIWNDYGTASAIGVGAAAAYNGDAKYFSNDTPYAAAQATFNDTWSYDVFGSSWTLIAQTKFDGTNGSLSMFNTFS